MPFVITGKMNYPIRYRIIKDGQSYANVLELELVSAINNYPEEVRKRIDNSPGVINARERISRAQEDLIKAKEARSRASSEMALAAADSEVLRASASLSSAEKTLQYAIISEEARTKPDSVEIVMKRNLYQGYCSHDGEPRSHDYLFSNQDSKYCIISYLPDNDPKMTWGGDGKTRKQYQSDIMGNFSELNGYIVIDSKDPKSKGVYTIEFLDATGYKATATISY
jgi:hypothetical protein